MKTERGPTVQGKSSEEACHFKYDHNFKSLSGTWFHSNHVNLRTRVVHTTARELSQVLCRRLLARRGGAVSRWTRKGRLARAWYEVANVPRSVAKVIISLVHLQGTAQQGIEVGKVS